MWLAVSREMFTTLNKAGIVPVSGEGIFKRRCDNADLCIHVVNSQ